jgi:hypothetical protein
MVLIDLIKDLIEAKLSLKSIWLKLKELIKLKDLIKLLIGWEDAIEDSIEEKSCLEN